MATVQEQLRLIGLSLSHAAQEGDLVAVHKWADKALALTTPHAKAAPAAQKAALAAPAKDSGLTNWSAAQIDAGFVFQASLGNTGGANTNPAPGAAKALGFSGVVGSGADYGVFKAGELVETVTEVPADGWGFRFGLNGFDNDAPYVKP